MTTTIEGLLSGPAGDLMTCLVMPDDPRQVSGVALLEDVADVRTLAPGTLVVLARSTQAMVGGYRLDVLVRQAVDSGVAALVSRQSVRRSVTAESVARRGRLALLETDKEANPFALFDRLSSGVAGDARTSLARIAAASAHVLAEDDDAAAMTSDLVRIFGIELTLVDGDDDPGVPVQIDGRNVARIRATDRTDAATVGAHLAGSMLSQELTRRAREAMAPVRTGSSLLEALLVCSQANLAAVSERAWRGGLLVHGWHCATRISAHQLSGSGDLATAEEVDDSTLRELRGDIAEIIASGLQDQRATWTVAQPDSTVVLVRTTRTQPGRDGADQIRQGVENVLTQVRRRHPGLHLTAGIATAHAEAIGLRSSAEESRAALASAEMAQRAEPEQDVLIRTFDALGLQRMLAEWAVTDTARHAVTDLLAPLDALGPQKAAQGIETLHAYLDERGSLLRAAKRLNLHRNAVSYRMNQLTKILSSDLHDPDQRFALQLACRARLMNSARR